MHESYTRMKKLVGQTTEGRSNIIDEELLSFNIQPEVFELKSPRGIDRHFMVRFDFGNPHELWLTANYDTYEEYPAANNNASGAVTLLGLVDHIQNQQLPVNLRVLYLDAGLDTDMIEKGRRNPDFVPGSEGLIQHLLDTDIDFIDTFSGAVTIQAAGKGGLCVFKRTGRKTENSQDINKLIMAVGKEFDIPISLDKQSPNADNLSFLKEGLEATVLARYHEGSWHRMQTRKDDITNVDFKLVDENIEYLLHLLHYNSNNLTWQKI